MGNNKNKQDKLSCSIPNSAFFKHPCQKVYMADEVVFEAEIKLSINSNLKDKPNTNMDKDKEVSKPASNDNTSLLYEHTFKLRHDSFIVNTVLPKFLEIYYRRQTKKLEYNIHNWNIAIKSNEVKVSFEYTRIDGNKFGEKVIAFSPLLQQQFHPFELASLFEVLNGVHSTTADDLIFKCYQYLEKNPDTALCPFKFIDYQLNSVSQFGSDGNLLDKNNRYYKDALDKVKNYLFLNSRAPFYHLKTFMKEGVGGVKDYYVQIISYFDSIDVYDLARKGYVKSVLSVPSIETEFIPYSDN